MAGGSANLHDQAVAVDGAGNLFVATATGNGTVTEFIRSGSALSAGTTLATGLNYPYNLALDGAGNLFVSTFNSSGAILELDKTPTGYAAPVTIASGLPYVQGLALDQAGNLFFAEFQKGAILEIPFTIAGYDIPAQVASGIANPIELAIDAQENLFVTSAENSGMQPSSGSVAKLPSTLTGYGAPVTIAGGLSLPWGLALQPSGSIVVATKEDSAGDDHTGQILEIPVVGKGFGSPVQIAMGLSYPSGVALDSAGDIFMTDSDSGKVLEFTRGAAPSLSFATTAGGSSTGSQTVAIEDIGTAPLYFNAVGYAKDFPEGAGGFGTDCTSATVLAPGIGCTMTIQFAPVTISGVSTSIPLAENVTFTTDNLNIAGQVQRVAVSGTETKRVSSLALKVSNANPSYGSQISLTVTATAVSPATGTPTGTVTFYAGGTPISSPLTLSAGTLTIQATITSNYTLTASYSGDAAFTTATSNAVPIKFTPAAPVITWAAPAAITYGTALSAAQLDASTSVAGKFVYTPALGAVPHAGTQTLSVTFTPANTTDYAAATTTVQLVVNKATPSITWKIPPAMTWGTPLGASQLNAGAPVAGSFAYTPAAGTVLPVGLDSLSTTFTPTDAADYTPAKASVVVTVLKAVPAISWPQPTAIAYGTALSATQLDATAKVTGSFVYSPPLGTVLTPGAQSLSVTFTPANQTDYTTAKASVTLTVNKLKPSLSWPTPAAILYGTALSATQLNAKASTPGSFSYSPILGTVLGAGPHTLTATFSPANPAIYASVQATVTLTVAPALLTVTPASLGKVYGAALPALTYGFTGFVNGDTAAAAVSGAPQLATTATAKSPVGSYPITAAAGTLKAANYSFAYVPGKLTVGKAQLKVAATNATAVFDTPLPKLTYSVAGFVNGDTSAVLSGSPAESTNATQGSPVGTYTISIAQGTLAAANYSFAFTNGLLTITPAQAHAQVRGR